MSVEQRLKELGLQLLTVPTPGANYANAVRTGNCHPRVGEGAGAGRRDDPPRPGEADVTTAEAAEHACLAGLSIVAILKGELGSHDRLKRIINCSAW